MKRKVFQSPLFGRQKKRLYPKEIRLLDQVVESLSNNPEMGEEKKGDLAGVYVHKFKIKTKLFLLAYEFDEAEILLITLGPHENFYRDLKKYMKV